LEVPTMRKHILSALLLMLCLAGIGYANDMKDVGPAPETVIPSCEASFDNLLTIDELIYFSMQMKVKFDLMLEDESKIKPILASYKKNKKMIDRQHMEWMYALKTRNKKWEKSCRGEKQVSQSQTQPSGK